MTTPDTTDRYEKVLMVHDELGGTPAVTTRGAFDDLHEAKGYRLLSEDEVAQAEVQRLQDETPGIAQNLSPLIVAQQTGDTSQLQAAYAGMLKDELIAEAQERGLETTGTKDELIARLVDHDGSAA